MSAYRIKPKWNPPNMGDKRARLRKYAKLLKNQYDLEVAVNGLDQEARSAVIALMLPHLSFTPVGYKPVKS